MVKQLILCLALLCSPAWATWTLTQVKGASCSSPCAVTVTSTGASHLLVAGIILPGGSTTAISSVTAAACTSTWTHAANTLQGTTASGRVDLYYCTNSASGQTSISITLSGTACGGSCQGVIWEASSSLGSIAVDSGATPSTGKETASCASPCAGTALTLGGNNDFIAVLGVSSASISALSGTGFTNDLANPGGSGVGHGITSGSLTAPATWTLSATGTTAMNAAAFQESSAVTCTPTLTLMGVGRCG